MIWVGERGEVLSNRPGSLVKIESDLDRKKSSKKTEFFTQVFDALSEEDSVGREIGSLTETSASVVLCDEVGGCPV